MSKDLQAQSSESGSEESEGEETQIIQQQVDEQSLPTEPTIEEIFVPKSEDIIESSKACRKCKRTQDLLRCAGCKVEYYCSPECQNSDWSSHRVECKLAQQELKEKVDVKRKTKSLDDFDQITWIGQGNFSEIYSAIESASGLKYAIKQINKTKLRQVNKEKDVVMEKHCLSRLIDNPYAVQIRTTFQDDENLYFQMQHVDGGELWQQIHILSAVGQSIIKYYFGHIIKAVESFHLMGIVHRDIKAENILLTQADKRVIFIDFGTACDLQNPSIQGSGNGMKGKRNFQHFVGTPHFMAPECIRNKGSSYKSDVYSLGCLFYQMICGSLPFEGRSEYLIFQKALETELVFPNDWILNDLQIDLIRKMMTKDINDRIELQGVMDHPYWGEDWDWQNIQDYGTAKSKMTEMETFLFETREKLFEVEALVGNKLKIQRTNEIISSKRVEVESNDSLDREDYLVKLKYLENQCKLFLLDEDQGEQFPSQQNEV